MSSQVLTPYHYTRVAEKDKKFYTEKMGKSPSEVVNASFAKLLQIRRL